MTLPASPPIKASDINVELGRAANAAFDINGASERALAGVPSGTIHFSDFLGKSTRGIEQTDIRDFITGTNPKVFAACSYGAVSGRSGIIILASHGDTTNQPAAPTCTVDGVNATRYESHTTGAGGGPATGTCIFTATPSGTSGDIGISWGPNTMPVGIIVLRVVGYNLVPAFTFGESASNDDGSQALTLAANDAVIALAGNGSNSANMVWSNLTERGEQTNHGAGGNNERGWAWDVNLPAGPRTISYTPWDTGQGGSAWSGMVLNAS